MDSLISGLGEKVAEEDGVVDIAAWMTFCAFDVMGGLCFGEAERA